jgi:hypothetical protein
MCDSQRRQCIIPCSRYGRRGPHPEKSARFFANYWEPQCIRDGEHGARFVTTVARKLNGYAVPHDRQLNGRLRMDEQVQRELEQGGVIDITTRGRHTGQPRRIEIRFHHIEGQVYITGRPPRRRDWYANLLASTLLSLCPHVAGRSCLGRFVVNWGQSFMSWPATRNAASSRDR